jgi:hypothetical protein
MLIISSLYNSNCLICLKLGQKDTNKSVLCCIENNFIESWLMYKNIGILWHSMVFTVLLVYGTKFSFNVMRYLWENAKMNTCLSHLRYAKYHLGEVTCNRCKIYEGAVASFSLRQHILLCIHCKFGN